MLDENLPAKAKDEPAPEEKKHYWRTTVGLVRRTAPFLGLNMLVYGAFFLATLLWLGIFGGLAALFGERIPLLAVILFIVAVAVPGGALKLARRYVLYLVKGAHIAALTKFLSGESPPGQMSQTAYGKELVKQNFRDMSLLFGLDQLVKGALKALSNTVIRVARILPLPAQAGSVVRWATQIMQRSLHYVDEAILSYAIAQRSDNVWASSRHGVILYGQAYKPILKTAVKIWAVEKVIFVATLAVLAVPGVLVLWTFNALALQVAVVVGTVLMAWLLVLAVFEPFAMTYVLVTYHGEIAGLTPDPAWDQRLQQVSKHFRELVGKARGATGSDDEPDALDTAAPALPDDSSEQATPPVDDARGRRRTKSPAGLGAGSSGLGGLGGLIGKAAESIATNAQQATQQTEAPATEAPATEPDEEAPA